MLAWEIQNLKKVLFLIRKKVNGVAHSFFGQSSKCKNETKKQRKFEIDFWNNKSDFLTDFCREIFTFLRKNNIFFKLWIYMNSCQVELNDNRFRILLKINVVRVSAILFNILIILNFFIWNIMSIAMNVLLFLYLNFGLI